jgi:hypothetical protein
MKAVRRRLSAVPEALEERENKDEVASILVEDEMKQICRDREEEDALAEAQDDEAAENEEDDELDEEDEVVRAAQKNL